MYFMCDCMYDDKNLIHWLHSNGATDLDTRKQNYKLIPKNKRKKNGKSNMGLRFVGI